MTINHKEKEANKLDIYRFKSAAEQQQLRTTLARTLLHISIKVKITTTTTTTATNVTERIIINIIS